MLRIKIPQVFNLIRAYLGEDLVEKTLVLSFKPERIPEHKKADEYVFRAKDYPCKFIISDGVSSFVDKNKRIQSLMEEINLGDTIVVSIRASDKNTVYDALKPVKIIGLRYNTIQLIPPAEVEKEERESVKMSGIFFLSVLLIGICVLVYKKIFSGN
ncbi:hypothetical protein [Chitinophaga tropicalis]|uniref:Uncharacterized protein n=1 Tax=Chitinophaga tropicalis TaxID=2683588 RepID=A0A7K1UEG0_9BACT|nr:hypothetical protein [Chitinophaga tropicalis]MVT12660.1 hypothetical protein [Chitinophaga tropicalis]